MSLVADTEGDVRFAVPLYTAKEAARYLDVNPSTFTYWLRGSQKAAMSSEAGGAEPILTSFNAPPGRRSAPTIPFVGLVEGLVLTAVRRSGVPLQRIRPAITALKREMDVEYALASKALYTDGVEVLFDFAEHRGDAPEAVTARTLVVVRNGQRVFSDVVLEYLQRIEYDPSDQLARLVYLPQYENSEVLIDPKRSFGKPIFAHGGARVLDVLERFWTGESLEELAGEFGVREVDLEDAVRVASRRAA